MWFFHSSFISLEGKFTCVGGAAMFGRLDCLKYLVEEAKVPIDKWHCIAWQCIACARYFEHPDCENYLLEKGCPEPPTDEDYASFLEQFQNRQWEEIELVLSVKERERERDTFALIFTDSPHVESSLFFLLRNHRRKKTHITTTTTLKEEWVKQQQQ